MSETPASPFAPRIRPTHERAIRAVKALDEARPLDARKNAEALPDEPISERAWKILLLGRTHLELGELHDAQMQLERAAGLALQWSCQDADTGGVVIDALRLAGEAFEHLGRALRRSEKMAKALRAHETAYQLRREHGSPLEQWESADSLATDHAINRDYAPAKSWCEKAIELARAAGFECHVKSLHVQANLFLLLDDPESAVDAARSTGELWRTHRPGSVERFLADRQLGICLLRHAETQMGEAHSAVVSLDEATVLLTATQRELSAFGTEYNDDAKSCAELLDLARRLRSSVQSS